MFRNSIFVHIPLGFAMEFGNVSVQLSLSLSLSLSLIFRLVKHDEKHINRYVGPLFKILSAKTCALFDRIHVQIKK